MADAFLCEVHVVGPERQERQQSAAYAEACLTKEDMYGEALPYQAIHIRSSY